MKRQRQGTPRRRFGPGAKSTERTLGILLRQSRLSRGLSLRKVAFSAGFTPMYLSLLERDACGPPSDEKLQALTEALGEPHSEIFFAKAGRVHPRVVDIVLQHPSEWTELLEAGKHLNSDQIESLKAVVNETPGTGKMLALLHVITAAKQSAKAAPGMNGADLSTGPLAGMPATQRAIAALQEAAGRPGRREPVLEDQRVQTINLPADAFANQEGRTRQPTRRRRKPAAQLPSTQVRSSAKLVD